MHGQKTSGHRLQTKRLAVYYLYYRKRGKFSPPAPPLNQDETTLAVAFQMKCFGGHAQSCIDLRHKLQITAVHTGDSARVVSPLSAWDLDLVQETLQSKEDQASDTTHIHICLATEILSRILNVRSVVSAANGKQSDDPTMGRAEKLL